MFISGLTICCVLSRSAFEKSVPVILAPPRSLLHGGDVTHAAQQIYLGIVAILGTLRGLASAEARRKDTCLVRMALLRLAFVRLASLRTARSIRTSDRSAFCTRRAALPRQRCAVSLSQASLQPRQIIASMRYKDTERIHLDQHLKVCASNHCLDEVCPLQLSVLEITVTAVCRCEI